MKNLSWKSIAISLCIIIFLVGLDQYTKHLIEVNMNFGDSFDVISGFFSITSHRNTGGAWGLASGKLTFLIIITVIALAVFVYLYKFVNFNQYFWFSFSISFIISGTLGNFIDRIFKNGKVTDFLDFIIFGYDFPIFNVADICLCIGTFLLAIEILFGKVGKLWMK